MPIDTKKFAPVSEPSDPLVTKDYSSENTREYEPLAGIKPNCDKQCLTYRSYSATMSLFSVLSALCIFSMLSVISFFSLLSMNSIMSICSANSVLSMFSANCFMCILCVNSSFCVIGA